MELNANTACNRRLAPVYWWFGLWPLIFLIAEDEDDDDDYGYGYGVIV